MKDIRLLREEVSNFKGLTHFVMEPDGHDVCVKGVNASGKSTVFDAMTYLLFGKNQFGETAFCHRPLDLKGNPIHDVDEVVEAVLSVDGLPVTLKRTVREKWTRHRGNEEKQYQGNVTEYEINGYPRKEAEFKQYIRDLVGEDVFKMITNPMEFTSLPWKKQREILMTFATHETDAEMARRFGGYDLIIQDLENAPSLDAVVLKAKGLSKDLAKKQEEIPIRIDELSATIVDYDIRVLENEKKAVIDGLNELKSVRENIDKIYTKIKRIESQMSSREQECLSEARKGAVSAFELVGSINDRLATERARIGKYEAKMASLNSEAVWIKKAYIAAQADYDAAQHETFPEENYAVDEKAACPVCGRIYPKEKINRLVEQAKESRDRAKKEFDQLRDVKMSDAKKCMADSEARMREIGEEVVALDANEADAKTNIEALEKQLEAAKAKYAEANAITVDMSHDEEYLNLEAQFAEAQKKMDDAQALRDALIAKDYDEQLWNINGKLASAEKSAEAKARIEDLRSQLVDVSQKIADNEHIIFLLDRFMSQKLTEISGTINSHFDGLNWKLFDVQVNGGTRETCELTVNGVPYSDLNASDKTIAGLKVISALQKLYGVSAFVFVDNAEGINDFRLPKMENQMILLKVTDDEVLKVEVE